MNEQTWIDPNVDRSKWPAGEWDGEPDKVQWNDEATGLVCLARRNQMSGNWCGYVGVAPDHPWHGKGYDDVRNADPDDEYVDVHGGLTYADACQEGSAPLGICHIPEPGTPEHLWWFGFDCHHAYDQTPQDFVFAAEYADKDCFRIRSEDTYRTLEYVKRQCRHLAAQVASARTSACESK